MCSSVCWWLVGFEFFYICARLRYGLGQRVGVCYALPGASGVVVQLIDTIAVRSPDLVPGGGASE